MANRIRITADLEALFPGENFQIGDQTIEIKPLNAYGIKTVVGKANAISKECVAAGLTMENYSDPDKFILLAELLVDKFPEVLEELSNIDKEDIQKLTPEYIVKLLEVCLTVNIKAKDSLLGNFVSLAEKAKGLMSVVNQKKK